MIRFHYHNSLRGKACHIYSTESVAELLEWGEAHGFKGQWLDWSRQARMPHFDAWGRMLRQCGETVSSRQCVEDLVAWRARYEHSSNPRGGD